MYPRLAFKLKSSCLSLPGAWIKGMSYHAWVLAECHSFVVVFSFLRHGLTW